MKSIAIITFQNANNYGAMLQNYALVELIESLGYSVSTINYYAEKISAVHKKREIISGNKNVLKKIYHTVWNLSNYPKYLCHYRRFENFRHKYLHLSECVNKNDLNKLSQRYDLYVCGSDQIWNKSLIDYEDYRAYTLEFVLDKPKCSFAASSGSISMFDEKMVEAISQLDIVTVRENSLSVRLSESDISCEVVLDPTLLLSRTKWLNLIGPMGQRRRKYVFMYFLESQSSVCIDIAKDISKELGVSVYAPICHNRKTIFDIKSCLADGPIEFINEIKNAEFVVASSFHGVVFSIIFEKEFVTVLHENTGARVKELLTSLNLEERIVYDYADYSQKKDKLKPINYVSLKKKLNLIKEKSMKELKKICSL